MADRSDTLPPSSVTPRQVIVSLSEVIKALSDPNAHIVDQLQLLDEATRAMSDFYQGLLRTCAVTGETIPEMRKTPSPPDQREVPEPSTLSPGTCSEFTSPYIVTEELARRIHYETRTILTQLKDSVLKEGRHYVRLPGRRRILWHWPHIVEDMAAGISEPAKAKSQLKAESPAKVPKSPRPAPKPPAKRKKYAPRGTVSLRWTEQDDAYLRKHFRRKTRAQIAAELGKSTTALSKQIRDLGLMRKSE